jgi:hypothetical protein
MINDAQIVLLTAAGLIIGVVILRYRQGKIGTLPFLLWFVLWVSAALVILFPNTTVGVARYLGIGRGVDLVLYAGGILILYLIFRMFVRFEQMDRNMTKIVRILALRDAGLSESKAETINTRPLPGENQSKDPPIPK